MASNTKMTPLKEEVLEKEGPEIRPDSPLLDLSDAAIKKLIRSAKKRGADRGHRGEAQRDGCQRGRDRGG